MAFANLFRDFIHPSVLDSMLWNPLFWFRTVVTVRCWIPVTIFFAGSFFGPLGFLGVFALCHVVYVLLHLKNWPSLLIAVLYSFGRVILYVFCLRVSFLYHPIKLKIHDLQYFQHPQGINWPILQSSVCYYSYNRPFHRVDA